MSLANHILKFSLVCIPFSYSRLPKLFCIALEKRFVLFIYFFKSSQGNPSSSFNISLDMEVFQGVFSFWAEIVKFSRIIIGFKVVLLFTGCESLAVPNLNFFFCKMGLIILVLRFAKMHLEDLWICCILFIVFLVLHHNFFFLMKVKLLNVLLPFFFNFYYERLLFCV